MTLSHEDSLRLNVLFSQELHAVRIDEGTLTLHALSSRGEARIALNVTGRTETYLRAIRELLSSHALGSPGGYPVFLKNWTRTGQARDESLVRLLLLGEPEAVVAVVCATGLSDELARRAWWAMPCADNARYMLERPDVVDGEMGPVLAQYLLEYLPFETASRDMIDSLRMMLQPGLLSEKECRGLWRKAQGTPSYYVGFLLAGADTLPCVGEPHPSWALAREQLAEQACADDPLTCLLLHVLSPAGQAFITAARQALERPPDQDVVVSLLRAIDQYFAPARPGLACDGCTMEALVAAAEATMMRSANGADMSALRVVLDRQPQLCDAVTAMLALSGVGEALVTPLFARTDAVGSVMRRRLEPVSTPMLAQFDRLCPRSP